MVSILTRPGGRVLHMVTGDEAAHPQRFQSSPGPGAGCCRDLGCRSPNRRRVSILTRPGGRVLLEYRRVGTRHRYPGFNPHPARGPGAADLNHQHGRVTESVSILTRPGGRVLPDIRPREGTRRVAVSILTRPGGRVLQPATACTTWSRISRFNPHPARGPGAAWSSCTPCRGTCRFNPHPARGPGAASGDRRGSGEGQRVSILTRPGGRVLPPSRSREHRRASRCFNPHPARGPGAARGAARLAAHVREVSILTRPGGRVLHCYGWAQHCLRPPCFNPHPARGPGAAWGGC